MGLEDLTNSISDFAGDIPENINDAVVDIEEFSKNAIEVLGDEGMEALGNGDIKGAIEYSDLSEEKKELVKIIVERVEPSLRELLERPGAKIAIGAFEAGAAVALANVEVNIPVLKIVLNAMGLDVAILATMAFENIYSGVKELVSQSESKNANALAAYA